MSTTSSGQSGRDGDDSSPYLRRGDYTLAFPPDRTALLVIDPVNDFLSEGGAGWEMTKTTVEMNDGERSIFFGSRGVRCSGRKCLLLKMVPASRLVIRA